jgi:hypothetical protein
MKEMQGRKVKSKEKKIDMRGNLTQILQRHLWAGGGWATHRAPLGRLGGPRV